MGDAPTDVQLGCPERETRSCISSTNVRGASQRINTPESTYNTPGFDAGTEASTGAANTHFVPTGDPELAARIDHRPPQILHFRMSPSVPVLRHSFGKDVL